MSQKLPHSIPPPRRHYTTIAGAAEYVGCNERTIRRHVAEGTLTGYRLGDRILRVDLDELMRRSATITKTG